MFEQESLISVPLKEIQVENANSYVESFVAKQLEISVVGGYKDPFCTSSKIKTGSPNRIDQCKTQEALLDTQQQRQPKKVDSFQPMKMSKNLQKCFANRLTIKMELHSKTVKRLFPAAPQPIKLIHHSEKEEIPQTPPLSESGNSVVLGNDATLDNAFVEDYSGECSNISNDLWNKDVSVEVAKPNQDLWETVKEIVEESVLSEQHSSFFSSSSYLDNYPDVKSTMGSIKPSADNEAIHSYSSSVTTATESETEIVVFQYPKHRLH